MNIYEYVITETIVYPNIIRDKACKALDYAYQLWYKMNVNNLLLSRFYTIKNNY